MLTNNGVDVDIVDCSFLAWSVSFYPQPILNIRRRSTTGLLVDFPLLNVLGFACYTISTSAFLFNETIRKQYAIRNPSAPIATVRLNDFAFALHALVLCLITYSQLFAKLWGFDDVPGKRASRATQGIFLGSVVSLILVAFIVMSLGQDSKDPRAWAAIDIVSHLQEMGAYVGHGLLADQHQVYAASYVKLFVTCIKYVPQAYSHFQHKSTAGWAIGGMILDLIGGVLSIAQIVIDSSTLR